MMTMLTMIRTVIIFPALFLIGCVSQSDIRTQVDQSNATLRQEISAAQSESSARSDKNAADTAAAKNESVARDEKLTSDIAAARSDFTARIDKLAADIATVRGTSEQRWQAVEQHQKFARDDLSNLRADLQRISGDLGRTVQDLQNRINASSGAVREHLQRQRAALADQLKSLDQVIIGFEGKPPVTPAPAEAPVTAVAPGPTPVAPALPMAPAPR